MPSADRGVDRFPTDRLARSQSLTHGTQLHGTYSSNTASGNTASSNTAAPFRVWTSEGNRWHLAGEADLLAQDALRSAMHEASAHGAAVVLDCQDLSFIDIAGLRAIAQAALIAGAPVTVNGANETLRRVWSLLDLDTAAPNVEFST